MRTDHAHEFACPETGRVLTPLEREGETDGLPTGDCADCGAPDGTYSPDCPDCLLTFLGAGDDVRT